MITVRVYDDYNSIALQAVDIDDLDFSEQKWQEGGLACQVESFQRSLEPKVVEI